MVTGRSDQAPHTTSQSCLWKEVCAIDATGRRPGGKKEEEGPSGAEVFTAGRGAEFDPSMQK